MAIKYTPSQERAIHTGEKSLLVSAAAGSGKTAVLVQRIIETVCREDGPDIDRLLVVTFTNAAAAEMKDKIYKEVMNRLAQEPGNKKLKRQLLLLSNANIQTMHSFCLNVIKNNINLLDIPVNFRIADETECNVMMQKCLTELVEDKYESDDTAFLKLADTYGYGRDDGKIYDLILSCHFFTSTLSQPEQYYRFCMEQAQAVTEDFYKTVFAKILINRLREILSEHEVKYRMALADIEATPDLLPYEEIFTEEYQFIKALQQETDFTQIQFRLNTFSFTSLAHVKGKKKGVDNSFLKAIREGFKEDWKKFLPNVSNSVENERKDAASILEFVTTLTELTKEFQNRYQKEKRKKSVIDFSDFEHFALQILSDENGNPSETAKSYQERFYEILIDEYQDTNDIQDHLFRLISKNGENLFLVGDVKQSIYGFRLAKPQIFMDKQESYQDDKHEVIFLSNNFRSRQEVVDAVNCVFSQTMTPATGRTDYKKEALIQTAAYESSPDTDYTAEILLFDKAQKFENPDEEAEEFDNEAVMIARRIHELVEVEKAKVYDLKEKAFRPASYGDIVILLRSMKEFAHQLYETLSEYGIPVSVDFSENLFSSVEIRVMLALLKAIDNPYDDLSLLALLKSPLFYWSEDDIFTVRNLSPQEPFLCALEKAQTENSKKVLDFLEEFQNLAYSQKISVLLETLYSRYHLKELFCVYRNPEQRMENFDILYRMALSFDNTQVSGFKGFLNYLEESMNSPKATPAFREQPPQNSVRIITMHKSKGLEYPIVFVSGLGKRLNNQDGKKQVIFHPDYGVGADYIDEKHRFSYPTLTKKALQIALNDESVSEEMRTLYVALTRAKEKLILTATLSNVEKSMAEWETVQATGGMTKNRIYNASGFIHLIMPCVLGNSCYRIQTVSMEDLLTKATKSKEEVLQMETEFPQAEHLFVPYHHPEHTTLPTKIAVTEANRLSKGETPSYSIVLADLDTLEERYSQSEYGTYFHKVFECVNLDAIKGGISLTQVISDAIALAGEREYSSDVALKMEQFFQTNLAKEILSADKVCREKSFLVRIPANKIYPVETTDSILLQGTTDCYFITGGTITLLDFKTDRNPNEEKIRANYARQIALYSYALEKTEELPVVKKYIYTAANNSFIEF